ncbi:MAG: tRNA 2-selenouridine(34) synthase MnmH [Thermodesulfobacteriota bacterium]
MNDDIDFSDIPTDSAIIDVRSPAEFHQGHIPAAINIPLFSDRERAEIGTIYKQESKELALSRGREIAEPKVADLIARARALGNKSLLVHCWRGGMRSSEVSRVLREAGLAVQRLSGGYKGYRRAIREFIDRPRSIIVLGGKTGSGKTAILLGLRDLGLQVIDLEGLAHHKGSVFGHINERPQPTTEQFENNLHQEMAPLDPAKPLLLENESHIIGSVHLPPPLLLQMRAAPLLMVEVTLSARVSRLVKDYHTRDREQLITAARRIEKKLTTAKLAQVIEFLEADDFAGACEILLGYYDYFYNRGLEKRRNQEIFSLAISGTDLKADTELVQAKVAKISGG